MTLMHPTAALALFQTGDGGSNISGHDVHLLMIFVGIIAVAFGVAAVCMILISIFAARLLHGVHGISCEVKERVGPLLDKTNAMVEQLSPKIHHMTENVEQMSYTVRAKVDELAVTVGELNRTVQDVNFRTRSQVSHVDGIVTGVLNAADDVSRTVQDGIKGPLRQVAGVIAGVKAGIEKLVERSPFGRA